MLRIEKADITHIPLIRTLTMGVWPQTYVPIIGQKQVDYMLDRFYTPQALQKQMEDYGHQFIICYSDGQPVAFASYGEIETCVYKMHKIYILPGLQGKGIGKFMLSYIVEELKVRHVHELRLNVNIHNHAAMAFYEKVGFRWVRDEDIDIGGGYYMNDHVLGLPL